MSQKNKAWLGVACAFAVLISFLAFIPALGGTNTLPEETGQIIQRSHVNKFQTALTGDLVPRNTSGVATDQAGGIGQSSLRWGTSYLDELFIGDPNNSLKLFDSSGLFTVSVGGSTAVEINGNGMDGAGIQNATVSKSKQSDKAFTTDGSDPGAGGVVKSPGSGSYTNNSTSYSDVPNLSVTLTTTGRPVLVRLMPDDGNSPSVAPYGEYGISTTDSSFSVAAFQITADGVSEIEVWTDGVANDEETRPCGFQDIIDSPAGTHTYKIRTKVIDATHNAFISHCRLIAYEL